MLFQAFWTIIRTIRQFRKECGSARIGGVRSHTERSREHAPAGGYLLYNSISRHFHVSPRHRYISAFFVSACINPQARQQFFAASLFSNIPNDTFLTRRNSKAYPTAIENISLPYPFPLKRSSMIINPSLTVSRLLSVQRIVRCPVIPETSKAVIPHISSLSLSLS